MGIFNLGGKKDDIKKSSSFRLFYTAHKHIEFMKDVKSLSKGGELEVLLLNSLMVLNLYGTLKPKNYARLSEEYFTILGKYIIDNKLHEELIDVTDFINQRMKFYSDEINKISQPNSRYMPSKIYFLFFKAPLSYGIPPFEELIESISITTVLPFSTMLNAMLKSVNNSVNVICKAEL